MKLNWKGNQRYNEDISKATIFRIEDPFDISVHKIHGLGEGWYLSVRKLNISQQDLYTEDFDKAEIIAIKFINDYLKELYERAKKLLETIK
jgi:hypothetical protein